MVEVDNPLDDVAAPPRRILVCGVNWLGDAILSMPALQAFRYENPAAELTLLVKPGIAPLWAMHAGPSRVLTLEPGRLLQTARAVRDLGFDVAYVLPHSFRSALIPWLGRIPARIGLPGHFPRDFLLTEVRRPADGPGREHQVFEYLDLFFPGVNRRTFVPPALAVPPPVLEAMHGKLDSLPKPWISLLPGAALGTPLVGLFGITNPGQTGPLGKHVRILQQSERRTRDVSRHSREARRALRAISVDDAVRALLPLLRKP